MESPLIAPATLLFREVYKCEPEVISYAPGRVNLIGEHTDYNDGFVCPFAIGLHTIVVGRRISGNTCFVTTTCTDLPEPSQSFPGDSYLVPKEDRDWSNYIKGVVASYRDLYKIKSIAFQIVISSNVPAGGGLSSSASIEVAVATFIESIYKLSVDKIERALLCQKAEHEYAHVKCGIMDQYISSCGKKGFALMIDCRSRAAINVPLTDPNIALIVCNSNKNHELSDGGYVSRVQQCQKAVEILQTIDPKIMKLRDANMQQLDQVKSKMDDTVYRRAKHSITEDMRTQKCLEALNMNDYATVGQLMYESHESLDTNYNVSTAELNALVKIARNIKGVYGSRMTGGGFGGCTVTLCQSSEADHIMNEMKNQYKKITGIDCSIFSTTPSEGAHIISSNHIDSKCNTGPCKKSSCCSKSVGKCCPFGGLCNNFSTTTKTVLAISILTIAGYSIYSLYSKRR